MMRLRDSFARLPIAGALLDGEGAGRGGGGADLIQLQTAIVTALGMADAMGLSMVGIHLDQARVELALALERNEVPGVVVTVPPSRGG